MATVLEPKPITAADFKGKVDPDWCPGCGDFGVLSSLQKVLAEMNVSPHNVVTISGIGCSSNLPGFIDTYGMHTLHGRALAVATGVKLANHKLHVVVTGGDGDGFGIGGNHFIHTIRPRGFSAEPKHLAELIKQGLEHKGFSFIDVFSPCVTYNHDNTYAWFRERVRKLELDSSYDSSDWHEAMKRALVWGDEIPIGKFFQRTDLPSLDQAEPILDHGGPLAHRELRIAPEVVRSFIAELM